MKLNLFQQAETWTPLFPRARHTEPHASSVQEESEGQFVGEWILCGLSFILLSAYQTPIKCREIREFLMHLPE